MKEIVILRYGHRTVRDYRVTSHCGLVARAFGANKIIICGEKDEKLEKTIKEVVEKWGGDFKTEFSGDWKKSVRKMKKENFVFVHLTMYGEKLIDVENKIKKEEKLCIIIGSQKVEKAAYLLSNYNISITNQPHSEIAALAVILDRLQEGNEFQKEWKDAKITITPKKIGKSVTTLK